jgi:hypothetical protein
MAEAAVRDGQSRAVLESMDPEGALSLRQSANVDSKAATFIQLTIQKALGAKIEILEHKNACDYMAETPCPARSDLTTYFVAAFYAPEPGQGQGGGESAGPAPPRP